MSEKPAKRCMAMTRFFWLWCILCWASFSSCFQLNHDLVLFWQKASCQVSPCTHKLTAMNIACLTVSNDQSHTTAYRQHQPMIWRNIQVMQPIPAARTDISNSTEMICTFDGKWYSVISTTAHLAQVVIGPLAWKLRHGIFDIHHCAKTLSALQHCLGVYTLVTNMSDITPRKKMALGW